MRGRFHALLMAFMIAVAAAGGTVLQIAQARAEPPERPSPTYPKPVPIGDEGMSGRFCCGEI